MIPPGKEEAGPRPRFCRQKTEADERSVVRRSSPRRFLAAALLLTGLGAGAAEAQSPDNTCSHFLAQCKQAACARTSTVVVRRLLPGEIQQLPSDGQLERQRERQDP
jgi:hypothetical protein